MLWIKKKIKKILHKAKQQSRKLDLLLAEIERQDERLKNLKDSKLSISKPKLFKSHKM